MKRQFEFRAWVRPGKMQYGVVPFHWDFCIDKMLTKCIESTGPGILGSGGDTAKWELGGFRYMNEEETDLMRFTGLRDKNGADIYEDDILRAEHKDVDPTNDEVYVSVVRFRDAAFWFTGMQSDEIWPLGDMKTELMEIVGNVHEHPHLVPVRDEPITEEHTVYGPDGFPLM